MLDCDLKSRDHSRLYPLKKDKNIAISFSEKKPVKFKQISDPYYQTNWICKPFFLYGRATQSMLSEEEEEEKLVSTG